MSKKDSLTLEYGSDRLFFVISQKMEEWSSIMAEAYDLMFFCCPSRPLNAP
jgi:hypothetical protein